MIIFETIMLFVMIGCVIGLAIPDSHLLNLRAWLKK